MIRKPCSWNCATCASLKPIRFLLVCTVCTVCTVCASGARFAPRLAALRSRYAMRAFSRAQPIQSA